VEGPKRLPSRGDILLPRTQLINVQAVTFSTVENVPHPGRRQNKSSLAGPPGSGSDPVRLAALGAGADGEHATGKDGLLLTAALILLDDMRGADFQIRSDFRDYPDITMGQIMSNTRIPTYFLAAALGVLFIGGQLTLRFVGNEAVAQAGPPNGLGVNVVNTPTVSVGNTSALAAAIAAANIQAAGTPVAFTNR
jgi:hypothetical protein